MPVRRVRARGAVVALAALVVAACSGSGGDAGPGHSPSATTAANASPGATDRRLVVLGDSIAFGGHFCPGCTAFADTWGQFLGKSTGHRFQIDNRSRDDGAKLADLESQLRDDEATKVDLGRADVVVISIGFNDTPPWPAGNPCGGRIDDDLDAQVTTVIRYTPACIDRGLANYRRTYDRIYAAIAALAPKTATLVAVNVYNNWIGNPGIRSDTSQATLDRLTSVSHTIYDSWNAMLCRSAHDHGFTCVDIYHAFNGASGRQPPEGLVQAQDYTHPSQAGNDAIAALLAKVPLRTG